MLKVAGFSSCMAVVFPIFYLFGKISHVKFQERREQDSYSFSSKRSRLAISVPQLILSHSMINLLEFCLHDRWQSTQAEEKVKLKGQQSELSSTLIMDFGSKHLIKRNDTIILSATTLSDAEELPPVLTLIESRIPWEKRDSIDSESMSPPDLGMTSTGVAADDDADDDEVMFWEDATNKSFQELDIEKLVDENMSKIDASFFILSEEVYCEDYEVPGQLKRNTIQTIVECGKLFCLMGCICKSLNSIYIPVKHCRHPDCIFASSCNYKSILRNVIGKNIPKKSDKFNCESSHSKHVQLEKRASMEIEVEFQNQTPSLEQKIDVIDKKLEIAQRINQIVEKPVIERSAILDKQQEDRIVVGGHYVDKDYLIKDSYPLRKSMLDELAKNNTVSKFIRLLMRKMFTLDFLLSMSVKKIKKKHITAIIGATMQRFKIYRFRNGESLDLTDNIIIKVMVSEFNNSKTTAKNKEMKSVKKLNST